jgi:D-alanyl-D-alanine carboxypeptidase
MAADGSSSLDDTTGTIDSNLVLDTGLATGGARSGLRAQLQRGLDALHADGMVGLVGEVSDGGARIDARSGAARAESHEPVAFDARFRMGSNTKTFVAVVILQLVEQGALGLDDTVERWLPGVVAGHGNDGTRITIRQLLQHTSGIFNYTQDLLATFALQDYLAMRFEHIAPEALVAVAMAHEPNFAPGAGWSYSNTNYVLAGMIIKKVTGRDWSAEVRARVTEPLQLSHTFDPRDWPDLPRPALRGYSQFTDGGPLVDVTLFNHTWADAAGALVTTANDLTRFWRALQSGALLGPAMMAEMHATVPAPELAAVIPGVGYGLGILRVPTRCGGEYWAHYGDTFGFSTRNAVDGAGTRAVVFAENTSLFLPAAQERVLRDDLQLLEDVMCLGR